MLEVSAVPKQAWLLHIKVREGDETTRHLPASLPPPSKQFLAESSRVL